MSNCLVYYNTKKSIAKWSEPIRKNFCMSRKNLYEEVRPERYEYIKTTSKTILQRSALMMAKIRLRLEGRRNEYSIKELENTYEFFFEWNKSF